MNPGYHETRFHFDPRREVLWATLCDSYFQELISPDDCVLDLGAGYSFAEHFELQAYARNVLNKAYFNTPMDFSALAPGISATLTGFVRF